MKFPRSMSQKIFWDFRFFPDLSGKIRIFYFLSQFLINFLFLFFVKNLFNFYIFFFYFWVFLLNLGSKMKIVQILKIPKVNESETPFSIYYHVFICSRQRHRRENQDLSQMQILEADSSNIYPLDVHSFYFIRTIFIRTLRLRFAPKFKKMHGLK